MNESLADQPIGTPRWLPMSASIGPIRNMMWSYARPNNSRQEKKILERLALIKEAKPLTTHARHHQAHGPES